MYGPFANEQLVGRAIADRRDQVVLATKFGNVRGAERRAPRASTAARTTCARRATPRCSGSASTTSTSTTSTASTRTRRSRRPSARWPSWSQAGKVRHLGLSEAVAADDPPGARRAPDHRAADRVLAVDPRPRGRRRARHRARAGHRLRRVQPARPRLPHRPDHLARRLRRGRLPARQPAVPGRELPAQPRPGRPRSARSPTRRAVRRGSWRWPG